MSRNSKWHSLALAVAFTGLELSAGRAATPGAPSDKARAPHYQGEMFPPWQNGANAPAINKGLPFTVPEVNVLADFHGNPVGAKLVIFVAGNYYFAMAPLVAQFTADHPTFKGAVFYETLPPGILLRQMKAHGTITLGNFTMSVQPDVFAAGLKKVNAAITSGILTGKAIPYVTNDLTIMIDKGNPAHIAALTDLGRADVRLAMPNPAWEGVARQIKASLVKAGGQKLSDEVYDTKVKSGTTILTHVHHRQTPLYLMQGLADAGVTWKSEAIFQEQVGHAISHIDIPAAQNTTAIYASAVVKGAAHPDAGLLWAQFLASPPALKIFEKYGFKAWKGGK